MDIPFWQDYKKQKAVIKTAFEDAILTDIYYSSLKEIGFFLAPSFFEICIASDKLSRKAHIKIKKASKEKMPRMATPGLISILRKIELTETANAI